MTRWLFTCEHGGNQVPGEWCHLFANAADVLQSHRGQDTGALCVFEQLEAEFADYALSSRTTRLLIDLNRSLHHRGLFSEYTRSLSPLQREDIRALHYTPWRQAVIRKIQHWRDQGHAVIHISFHSFTPQLNGKARNTDIGLLYDPGRPSERQLCKRWRQQLKHDDSEVRVRMNYPYRGTADGFTTELRRRYTNGYSGIELELNSAWVEPRCKAVANLIRLSLSALHTESQYKSG